MNLGYFADGATIPLLYPGVTALFDLLRRTCDEAKVELRPATVGEVYRDLAALDGEAARHPRAPASPASSPRARKAALEAAALTQALAWIGGGEKSRRSAGDYYLDRFGAGRFFTDYDLYTAEYCARELADAALAVELGCGFGELSLLLASEGFRTVGIESAAARHDGASSLLRGLTKAGHRLGELSYVVGTYPDKRTDAATAASDNAILVCTHVTSSSLVENMAAVIRSLNRFRHLIIDVSTFGVRRDASRIKELVAQILAAGFEEAAIVYQDAGADVRHFRRRETLSAAGATFAAAMPAR
jgi:hypothetical protein